MILKSADITGRGAYADIFRRPGDIIAYKLFVSGRHSKKLAQELNRQEDDDDRRRKTFCSQCKAYQIAAADSFLSQHIPNFHGPRTIQAVLDGAHSIADQYMLNHCYAIEYINGKDTKLGAVAGLAHIVKALKAFHDAGIHHLIDASVFMPEDPQNFKFIDFALEEYEAYW